MSDTASMNVGFVGLGKMGTPMCKHIRAAGNDVTAYVRNDAARDKAASINVNTADSLAELASRSIVVVSAVTDDAAMLDVASGPRGPHEKRQYLH